MNDTKKITREQIKLLQQWKDNLGAKFEWERSAGGDWFGIDWRDVPAIVMQGLVKVRIKPLPKKRIRGWVNIYPMLTPGHFQMCGTWIYPTREDADQSVGLNRIACIEIDVEEGTGLGGEHE